MREALTIRHRSDSVSASQCPPDDDARLVRRHRPDIWPAAPSSARGGGGAATREDCAHFQNRSCNGETARFRPSTWRPKPCRGPTGLPRYKHLAIATDFVETPLAQPLVEADPDASSAAIASLLDEAEDIIQRRPASRGDRARQDRISPVARRTAPSWRQRLSPGRSPPTLTHHKTVQAPRESIDIQAREFFPTRCAPSTLIGRSVPNADRERVLLADPEHHPHATSPEVE
jgi:hypothetical protein